jgi:alkylated DNA nucleotide flippase Atl1
MSIGSRQDLQALRYAAYSSALTLEDLLEIHVEYQQHLGRTITKDVAREEFEAHAPSALLEETIDENTKPRMMLVAKSFQDELVWTCLWLIESYGMDIACVQIVPYEVEGRRFLSSSTRIPLPEVADHAICRDAKRRRTQPGERLDWQRVIEVVAAIPPGRWMSYADVAEAAGSSRSGAMAVGSFLANSPDTPPSVHRVLREDGRVSAGWRGEIGGPEECRALPESEGLTFDDHARADAKRRFVPAPEPRSKTTRFGSAHPIPRGAVTCR